MILIDHASKTYWLNKRNPVHAVLETCLEIKRGEFFIITGRSGSGKTTLLNLIAGLTRPNSGQIYLDGEDLWSLSDQQQSCIRNQKIGFIFQFPSLLPSLTALENIILPTILSHQHIREPEAQRAMGLLETVGLKGKEDVFPRQLSAGQQQRVVVARALINRPELLLADEPTSDLDEQTEIEIMELFKEMHTKLGITIVLVSHTNQLVSYSSRSLKMVNGTIIS